MAIVVRSLTKRYGSTQALDAVGFTAYPGQVLGIIGPNGSGKSTLLLCMAGLADADDGEVLIDDQVVEGGDLRLALICIEDGLRPWEDQRVSWLLRFWTRLHRHASDDTQAVIAALGVDALLQKKIGQLSKGQRKRVMLALGLLASQPIALFDEPFDGLDLRQARAASEILRSAAANGRTIILSMHQLDMATRVCDRVVLLDNARVAGEGTVDELRAKSGIVDGNLEEVFLALT